MRKSLKGGAGLCLAAIAMVALTSTSASAAYQSYVKVKGAKQGKYGQGGSAQQGVKQHKHIGNVKYEDFNAKTSQKANKSPRDAATGQATGKRMHKP